MMFLMQVQICNRLNHLYFSIKNNLESRSDISNINTVKENLNNIFTLVNELDLVLS